MGYLKSIKAAFIINRIERRGAQQQLFSFLKFISDYIDICVFCFGDSTTDFPEFLELNNVKTCLNKRTGKYNILKFGSLYEFLKRENPNVMITVGLGAALFFGRINALICNIKIVYSILNTTETFHQLFVKPGDYFDVFNKVLNSLIPRFAKKSVFKFLPNSNQLTIFLRQIQKNYEIHPLLNAISLQELDKILLKKPDDKIINIKSKISGRPTIVQVGALDDNKNQIYSLKCLKVIKVKLPDIMFVIIGDGEKKEELIRYSQQNNIDCNVFFAGHLERRDCIHLMNHAHLLVLTSHSESFPNVLLEAQSLGLPVVSFDVGATSDILVQGESGYIIENRCKKKFIDKVLRILLDEKLANFFRKKGKHIIYEKFSMKKKVAKFLKMLNEDIGLLQKKN